MEEINERKSHIEEQLNEKMIELREQRRNYDSIHYLNIIPLHPDEYYNSLKDYSSYKVPKDHSQKDADKDVGISLFLKAKAFFSDTAKKQLEHKKEEANVLAKEYADYHLQKVERGQKSFYQKRDEYNSGIDNMKERLVQHKDDTVKFFFLDVLYSDEFTLSHFSEYEHYSICAKILGYDQDTSKLSYEYRLPNINEISVVKSFDYNEKVDWIITKDLDEKHSKNIRIKIARALLLRTAAKIFYSDEYLCVKKLHIVGYISFFNKAFGKMDRVNVIEVELDRDIFDNLNLERLVVNELFERVLNVKQSKSLYERPISELKSIN